MVWARIRALIKLYLPHLRGMFNRLKSKWSVTGLQLVLVLCTFAIGGSLCGFLGRKFMALAHLPVRNWGILAYVLVVTVLWPICVLAVSLPLGQFSFFRRYLQRVWHRLGGKSSKTGSQAAHHIAIFASGSGSNAQKIITYFESHPSVDVRLVVSNNAEAAVLQHAKQHGIATLVIEKQRFLNGDAYLPELKAAGITTIVLAGFLQKVPTLLIDAFPGRIVNIHPALLPRHGGKGMYGKHVHAAVIAEGDNVSGITIHLVDAQYDHGPHLFSAKCAVLPTDDAETLAKRVLALEHQHYAPVIENWLGAKPS
jgi:formyltetrahydrofolate-dependent phosphoribosylglycinamide formyltransferase